MPSEWRFDERSGRAVRIAPVRAERPSDFAADHAAEECPFCAGAEGRTPPEVDRVGDGRGGWLARVVPNRYPAFDGADGAHEVVIESPRHSTRFIDLTPDEAAAAVTLWGGRLGHYRAAAGVGYELVFKNEGPAAGASLAHAHSQVVALHEPPRGATTGSMRPEEGALRVATLGDLAVWSPPAPRFAYETWIGPLDSRAALSDELSRSPERAAEVAATLRRLLGALARLGAEAVNVIVQSPRGVDAGWWIEVAPRSASIAGFELATGCWINSVPPEAAADSLNSALDAAG